MNRIRHYVQAAAVFLAFCGALALVHPQRAHARQGSGDCVAVQICNDRPMPFQQTVQLPTRSEVFSRATPRPLFQVPAGQRLTIEHVNVLANFGNGPGMTLAAARGVPVALEVQDAQPAQVFLPTEPLQLVQIFVPPSSSVPGFSFRVDQNLLLFAGPGTTVFLDMVFASGGGPLTTGGHVTITGHLTNVGP